MNVAFCLYKYFPYGGLQRDFMRIASTVAARGNPVRIYVQSWQGKCPAEFELINVPVHAQTNHGRNSEYYAWVQQHLSQHPVDKVVGFNKMPGLDIYYAADVCYAAKVEREKGFWYRMTGRYRHYAAFEKATFERGLPVQLLMLTSAQLADFQRHYHTEPKRFHMLPPGIYPDRKYDQVPPGSRELGRSKNGIQSDELLLLQVGSDFRRKGVDRSLRAIAALPDTLRTRVKFMVVGQDKPNRFKALAGKLGIEAQVTFCAGRDDVTELMAAADLLLHPAYQEAAGIVLLEAIAGGLPVLVNDICGYAHYISEAQCGLVINEPFQQQAFNDALKRGLSDNTLRQQWADNARYFADTQDIYSLPEKAADIILGECHG